MLHRTRWIIVIFAILLLSVHEGTLLSLLLVHKLVINTVVQVCIIVLLVDSILLSALRAEFNDTPWCNKIGHLFWPYKWRIVFLNLFNLVSLVNKH